MSKRRRGVDLRWDSIKTSEGVKPSVFTWLARTDIGVRAGSRPIGWVQMHNMAALDAIEKAAREVGAGISNVYVRQGVVFADGKRIGHVGTFYGLADRMARR